MGTPLDSLRIRESNWEYSELLRDALTALAWGIDVEDFWMMSSKKRALLTETVVVKSQMRSYEDELAAENARSNSEKPVK